jgi:hypothetical protein
MVTTTIATHQKVHHSITTVTATHQKVHRSNWRLDDGARWQPFLLLALAGRLSIV